MLCGIALLTRCQQFGNPIVHIDEQFYLLVGDRMLHGAVPYVDIWDRKPVGLFLLYAGARLLGGAGVLQYQLLATGFAIATALIVERIASRITGRRGAWLAAILYLLWLPLLTGSGGQSPVFYNLFVAGAALAIVTIADAPATAARIVRHGLLAMLLIGIAMQIKYSALFEGLYFGLALVLLAWRSGMPRAGLLLTAAGWIAAALLPTALAGAWYERIGQFPAFWYANFVSIRQRGSLDPSEALHNAAALALYLAPLVIIAADGAKHLARRTDLPFLRCFLPGWFAASLLSVILFGYYFDHYGLPIVAPAAACAALFLDDPRRRRWSAAVLAGALIACLLVPIVQQRRRGTPAQFAALATAVRPHAARGLLVWDDYPALYMTLNAPLPTHYPFPTHLRDNNERGAIGVDQDAEMRRILDARPASIVIDPGKTASLGGPTTVMLRRRLAGDYHRTATVRVGRRDQFVYVLNGL